MTLYSYKTSYPQPLPFRIRLPNGQTRTDPSTFTAEEIADAGYIAVNDPPEITTTQVLTWNSETVSWEVRDKTEQELRAEYIASIPTSVTMRQARLALLQQGLLQSVNTTLSTMEGPEGEAARIEWEYASDVERNSPLLQGLTTALGWSEDQVLELFILASSL